MRAQLAFLQHILTLQFLHGLPQKFSNLRIQVQSGELSINLDMYCFLSSIMVR